MEQVSQVMISRVVAAAAARVCEQHKSRGVLRYSNVCRKLDSVDSDTSGKFAWTWRRRVQRSEMSRELGPTFEGVLAGDDQLRIRQLERGTLDIEVGQIPQARMIIPDTRKSFRRGVGAILNQILGLFLVLFEVGKTR